MTVAAAKAEQKRRVDTLARVHGSWIRDVENARFREGGGFAHCDCSRCGLPSPRPRAIVEREK